MTLMTRPQLERSERGREGLTPLLVQLLEDLSDDLADRLQSLDTSGPRYVVGCRSAVQRDKLKMGVRVSLDMTTLTIMPLHPTT
jgi:ATP-dependent 26S proteasome regulatory subunit